MNLPRLAPLEMFTATHQDGSVTVKFNDMSTVVMTEAQFDAIIDYGLEISRW